MEASFACSSSSYSPTSTSASSSSTSALDASRQATSHSALSDRTSHSPDGRTACSSTFPPGEMRCDSTSKPDASSNASPRQCNREERPNNQIATAHNRCRSEKRLHPPLAKPKGTGDRSCYDPSLFIPTELLFRCTSYLDPQSLLQLQLVSKFYNDLARRNEAGWADLCHYLWLDKAVVAFRDRGNGLPRYDPPEHWMQGYFSARADAKRASLTVEDLVFDPAGRNRNAHDDSGTALQSHSLCPGALLCRLRRANNVWSFRFKESAGSDWTGQDPWYSGEPCRKLVFMRDGTILHYVEIPPADTSITVVRTAANRPIASSSATEPPVCSTASAQYELKDPPLPMRWRFLSNRPIDLPNRPFGSYVRMSVGGRDVPTYSVFRCEANWGFVMESCWGLYANFELPPRRHEHPLVGQPQQGVVTTSRIPLAVWQRRRLRRAENGTALWVSVDEDEESDVENHNQARSSDNTRLRHLLDHPSVKRLQDDTNLVITNEVQWREAFLYNVGALVLPEGDEATSHFDRAWQGGV